jgi:hypothetical protein
MLFYLCNKNPVAKNVVSICAEVLSICTGILLHEVEYVHA